MTMMDHRQVRIMMGEASQQRWIGGRQLGISNTITRSHQRNTYPNRGNCYVVVPSSEGFRFEFTPVPVKPGQLFLYLANPFRLPVDAADCSVSWIGAL